MKRRVALGAKSRQISQALVLRDALTNPFDGSELVDEDFWILLSRAVVKYSSKCLN